VQEGDKSYQLRHNITMLGMRPVSNYFIIRYLLLIAISMKRACNLQLKLI
jgi:hypothetical protein